MQTKNKRKGDAYGLGDRSRDCAAEAFEESYAEQTFQHQNTASRLGFLLALDQTDHGGQTLHLSDSVRPMKLTPKDETEPR